jgi:AcrR family transcriptional regulator
VAVREALLRAAIKVFAETGTRGATTRRNARQAGVNEVTLFRHFGSKDVLLRDAVQALYDRSVPLRLPAHPLDPARELTDWCWRHHEFLCRIRSILRINMAEYAEHPERVVEACKLPVRVADELHAYLLRLRARGLARGRWNARAASAMLMGAVFSDATQRDIMPERFPYSEREAIRQYVSLFVTAIGVTREPAQRRGRNGRHHA